MFQGGGEINCWWIGQDEDIELAKGFNNIGGILDKSRLESVVVVVVGMEWEWGEKSEIEGD